MKALTTLVFLLSIAGCSSPDDSQPTDVGRTTTDLAADAATTADVGRSDVATTVPDQGSDMAFRPDTGQPATDMSTLPTSCTNDCLCESDCTHRCNIECQTECAAEASCSFSLNAGARITCRAGSTCDISCESGACEVTCEPGASCNLRCGPQTVACFFVTCGGTEEECSNRQKTCDSAC